MPWVFQRGGKRIDPARRQTLVVVAQRVSLPRLGYLWLLDRIRQKDRVAFSDSLGGFCPLYFALSGHHHVLLVPADPGLETLWYIYTALFIITTFLNVSSHQKPVEQKT